MFWYTLIKTSELKELQEYCSKDQYLIADSFCKTATDKELKNPKNNTFPNGITYDMIDEWIMDRKQNKIVIILKK